jgi:hypothetical protein
MKILHTQKLAEAQGARDILDAATKGDRLG